MAAAASSTADIKKLKWGIIGCANIAKKNARAIALSESAELVAVASRDLKRCEEWAKSFSCVENLENLTCYGSYDELLNDPNVDAVYMPLPTKMHKEWVLKASKLKKHVLVEKPSGCDVMELKHMIDSCIENDVMFMDGCMFMHHERMERMKFELHNDPAKLWGQVGRVSASFTFNADKDFITPGGNIRTSPDGDPLGCLGDLGFYCIRYGLFAFEWKTPSSCRAINIRRNSAGVPIDVSAEIYWGNKGTDRCDSAEPYPTLSFHCSFLHSFKQRVEVTGNKRRITCDDFVVSDAENANFTLYRDFGGLDDVSTRNCEVSTLINAKQPFNQEANMFSNFAKCVNNMTATSTATSTSWMEKNGSIAHEPLSPIFWSQVSMQTQLVIDSILESDSKGGVLIDIRPPPALLE